MASLPLCSHGFIKGSTTPTDFKGPKMGVNRKSGFLNPPADLKGSKMGDISKSSMTPTDFKLLAKAPLLSDCWNSDNEEEEVEQEGINITNDPEEVEQEGDSDGSDSSSDDDDGLARPFKCNMPNCKDKHYRSPFALKKHFTRKHPELVNKGIYCSKCNLYFRTQKELDKHRPECVMKGYWRYEDLLNDLDEGRS
ncbi:hypothetical protein CASFOL_004501 [Castilleja foliolosa]|uniref:C2H2-type domain-containing protein n=1 Tax=Castilleja foliolosa TaxID=1961234 RepID=A0ABD3EEQ1_9LAMI